MALLAEEKPAYKMVNAGTGALTDIDLIAMLIGGNADKAAELARMVFGQVGSLRNLGKVSISDLLSIGLTERQATTIIAAVTVGVRIKMSDIPERQKVGSSNDAYRAISPVLENLAHEEFWIITLNRANQITKKIKISTGGQSGTVADMKLIFREALMQKAAGIILVHNHPSGNLTPSQADKDVTRKAIENGKFLEMPVLDHIIVSERGYYSFADEGAM